MPAHRMREEALARPRERRGGETVPVTRGVAHRPIMPEPDPSWGTRARILWDSAATSGQVGYWQSSDWATLWSACSLADKSDKAPKPMAMVESVIAQMLGRLMFTESDRRSARIELDAPATPIEPDWLIEMRNETSTPDYSKEIESNDG